MPLNRTLSLVILTSFFWLLTNGIHVYGTSFDDEGYELSESMRHYQDSNEAEDRKARQEWLPLAEEGDAEAQTSLGKYYEHGWGGPKDLRQARDWYRKAAEQDYALAQFELGRLYERGRGVPQDYRAARDWYRKAAEQGQPQAQYSLGDMYKEGRDQKPDYVQSYMWYNLAAAQGYKNAATSRDDIAKKLTYEQIAEAQRLAREWKPTPRQK